MEMWADYSDIFALKMVAVRMPCARGSLVVIQSLMRVVRKIYVRPKKSVLKPGERFN